MTSIVVVSVGTDYHPFDRLILHMSNWVLSSQDTKLIVQHGRSPTIRGAENHELIPRDQLLELFRTASALVTQVGPGTILDANSVGRRPIVMPRDPTRGEHVDNHQLAFGTLMHSQGNAILVQTEPELISALELALEDPNYTRIAPRVSPAPTTAVRLAQEIDALGRETPPRVPSLKKIRIMLSPPQD